MDQVILYGAGRRCRRFLSRYPEMNNYVRCLVDQKASKISPEAFLSPVFSPSILHTSEYQNCKIVITPFESAEIETILREKYHIPEENITLIDRWAISLLKQRKIVLRPECVRLDICTLCQLDCRDCYMRREETAIGSGIVSLDVFEGFLKKHPFIKKIEISNSGEPFLHPQLHELLTITDKLGIEIQIMNGANFNDVSDEVMQDLVTKNVKVIRVSIDGATQEVYSVYRRKGDFNRVISNIRKLNEMKQKFQNEYPKLIWQFVVMSHNLCDIEKARQLAAELDMSIEFKESWNFHEQEKVREQTAVKKYAYNDGDKKEVKDEEVQLLDFESLYCQDLFLSPQINYDGRLFGCCSAFKKDWGMNVFQDGLLNCINSDVYLNNLIQLIETGSPLKGTPCEHCHIARVNKVRFA